jgi:conjugal transfer mating pair stabilization protein TraG
MTVNVITSGGGQYIVNVLNAVAAWTGGGGFRSLLQVVMVMGLGYSLLVMAFSLNWRVLFHWFLSATAMYMCMIVPTTTVVVSDTINPTVGNGAVANVPIGLAMVASFSSQVNNWLTKTAESVFTMPSALTYSAGGMIYPTRLNDLTSQFTIADPIMKANIEGYLAQCTFYDILLGQGMAGRRWPVRRSALRHRTGLAGALDDLDPRWRRHRLDHRLPERLSGDRAGLSCADHRWP